MVWAHEATFSNQVEPSTIVELDLIEGNHKPVTTLPDGVAWADYVPMTDPAKNLAYLLAAELPPVDDSELLMTFDLVSGALVSTVTLDQHYWPFALRGDRLLAFAHSNKNTPPEIVEIAPASGEVTALGSLSGDYQWDRYNFTYDAANDQGFTIVGPDPLLLTFDAADVQIVNAAPIVPNIDLVGVLDPP